MFKDLKKNMRLIGVYSDTHPLEIFNGMFLLFINSSHLMLGEGFKADHCFFWLGVFSIFLGLSMIGGAIHQRLKFRIRISRFCWAFCVCVIFLMWKNSVNIEISYYFSYMVQSLGAIFIVGRLNNELFIRESRGLSGG